MRRTYLGQGARDGRRLHDGGYGRSLSPGQCACDRGRGGRQRHECRSRIETATELRRRPFRGHLRITQDSGTCGGWDYRDGGKVVVVVVVKAKDSTRDASTGHGHQRHRAAFKRRIRQLYSAGADSPSFQSAVSTRSCSLRNVAPVGLSWRSHGNAAAVSRHNAWKWERPPHRWIV